MVFATMPGGTMYYTLGTGVSAMLTKKLDRKVTVQPYGGSSVYLPLIDAGEAQLGFSSSLDADAAFRGTDRKPLKNLRAVARVWGLKVALMAREKSGLKTVKDLKGKRVVVDFKGQVAMGKVVRAMLATGGLGDKDVKGVTVGNVRAGNEALIKGNVDVTFIAVGIPLVKQANSKIPGGVRYIDLAGGDLSAAMLGKHANGVYATEVKPAKQVDLPDRVGFVYDLSEGGLSAAVVPYDQGVARTWVVGDVDDASIPAAAEAVVQGSTFSGPHPAGVGEQITYYLTYRTLSPIVLIPGLCLLAFLGIVVVGGGAMVLRGAGRDKYAALAEED